MCCPLHNSGNGTEDIVRRYQHPSKLFFYSVHLYEKEETGYEFFPGSGADDDTVRHCKMNHCILLLLLFGILTVCCLIVQLYNIINVPIPPIWQTVASTAATAAASDSSSESAKVSIATQTTRTV